MSIPVNGSVGFKCNECYSIITINDFFFEIDRVEENPNRKTRTYICEQVIKCGKCAETIEIKLSAKENIVKNNTIIFSSSSEASKAYEEMQHGMFTYFLLKKLKETKGNASLQDIYDYTYFQVREKSLLINSQIQTPTIVKSPAFTKSLDEIKL